MSDRWLTGIGLDTTQVEDPSHLAPHNIAVQLFVETGVLGCAAGLAAAIGFAVTLRRRRAVAHTRDTQILAVATGAVGIMVLAEGMAANVLTQTIVYGYSAAALAWGLFGSAPARTVGVGGDRVPRAPSSERLDSPVTSW